MAMQQIVLSTRIDDKTGEVYVVAEQGDGGVTWLFPFKQAVQLMDYHGHRGEIDDTGAVKVAEWGGTPQPGYDIAGEDTGVLLCVPGPGCTHLSATCLTNGAALSLDGGLTYTLTVAPGTTPVFSGLLIQPAQGIYGRNAVAGSAYASLNVAVW